MSKCKCACSSGDKQTVDKSKEVLESVKEYYGKVLKKTSDLKTDACCTAKSRMAKSAKEALALVHDDVVSRYYGCGLIVPECLEGMKILDLGSGAGQDCYVLSKLVGEQGHVTGIDMTDEQLEVARKYQQFHADKFGFSKPNTDFVKGYIESLGAAGLGDNQFNLIVSNCVVNLSPDKRAVLTEACRVLKEGGEFFFGDVYADRDLPEEIRKHKVLWGECIAGSLWWKDLYKIAEQVGFSRPRLFAASKISVKNAELEAVLGDSKFVSVTYRLFKLPQTKEPVTEVVYNGGITDFEDSFILDHEWTFTKGKPEVVSSEVASVLKTSRFTSKFTFTATDKKPAVEEVVMVNPFEYVARDASENGSKCCPSDKGQSSKCCPSDKGQSSKCCPSDKGQSSKCCPSDKGQSSKCGAAKVESKCCGGK